MTTDYFKWWLLTIEVMTAGCWSDDNWLLNRWQLTIEAMTTDYLKQCQLIIEAMTSDSWSDDYWQLKRWLLTIEAMTADYLKRYLLTIEAITTDYWSNNNWVSKRWPLTTWSDANWLSKVVMTYSDDDNQLYNNDNLFHTPYDTLFFTGYSSSRPLSYSSRSIDNLAKYFITTLLSLPSPNSFCWVVAPLMRDLMTSLLTCLIQSIVTWKRRSFMNSLIYLGNRNSFPAFSSPVVFFASTSCYMPSRNRKNTPILYFPFVSPLLMYVSSLTK